MLLNTKEGIVVRGPLVNLALAAIANAAVVFTIPILAGQLVGVKSAQILKVNLFNNGAGNTQVIIGTGVAGGFLPLLPALPSMNNLEDPYGENSDLVQAETFLNITAYPVALVAAGSIDIRIEVLVRG